MPRQSAAVVAAACAALAAGPAATREKPIGITRNGIDFECAVNASGSAAAAWFYQKSRTLDPVLTRMRPPGGDFGPAMHIPKSDHGAPATLSEHDPRLHIAANGIATIVFTDRDTLYTADARAAGIWRPAMALTPAHNAESFRAAFNAAGDAVVVWDQGLDTPGTIAAATRHAGGAWSAPVTVVTPADKFQRVTADDVAIAGDGAIVVAYETANTAGPHTLRDFALHAASAAAPGAPWILSGPLAGGRQQGIPLGAVAAAANGGAAALVTLLDYPTSLLASVARANAAAGWSMPHSFAPPGFAFKPHNDWTTTFATDASGHATLIGVDDTLTLLAYDLTIASHTWSAPTALSAAGVMPPVDAGGQQNPWALGVAPDGSAVAAFFTAQKPAAYAENRAAAGAAWSAPARLLSAAVFNPIIRAAAASGGTAAVAIGIQPGGQDHVFMVLKTTH